MVWGAAAVGVVFLGLGWLERPPAPRRAAEVKPAARALRISETPPPTPPSVVEPGPPAPTQPDPTRPTSLWLRASEPAPIAPTGIYGSAQGIPILMFHRFRARPTANTAISPEVFRTVLETLKSDNYCLIGLDEYLENRFRPECGGQKLFAVTFDDGHPSQFGLLPEGTLDPQSGLGVLEEVFPNARATFFLNVRNGGKPFGKQSERKVALLREWGLEIGNHTISHPRLDRVSNARAVREIDGVCDYFDQSSMLLAYPYGVAPRTPLPDLKTRCAVPAAFNAWEGYAAGVRGGEGRPLLAVVPAGSSAFEAMRYSLPRVNIASLEDLRLDVLENPGVYTLPAAPAQEERQDGSVSPKLFSRAHT